MEYFGLTKKAVNSFTKKYGEGKLSPEDLTRLQQAGVVRSADQMAAGIHRGNEGILKKEAPYTSMSYNRPGETSYSHMGYPYNRIRVPDSEEEAHLTYHLHSQERRDLQNKFRLQGREVPREQAIKLWIKQRGGGKLQDAVSRRHEVYEASESVKAHKQGLPVTSDFYGKEGTRTGAHTNLAVIGRENNLVNRVVPPSPYADMKAAWKNIRENTQEPDTPHWIKSTGGTPYGDRQLSSKEFQKLRKPGDQAELRPEGRVSSLLNWGTTKNQVVAHHYPAGYPAGTPVSPSSKLKDKALALSRGLGGVASSLASRFKR